MEFIGKRKKLLAVLLIALVTIVLASSHPLQLACMEHISLREFYVRMIAQNQTLNISSPWYGSFGTIHNTVSALNALRILEGLDSINQSAVMRYIIGENETGAVDNSITATSWGARRDAAYKIICIAAILDRLNEIPTSLLNKIRDVVKENVNRTSQYDWRGHGMLWLSDRRFVFEIARRINETADINFTLHESDILTDLRKHLSLEPFQSSPEGIHQIWFDLIAYDELFKMWIGHENAAGFHLPDDLRNTIAYYIVSLWNPEHGGFSQDFEHIHPQHNTQELWVTHAAVDSYDRICGGLNSVHQDWRHQAFKNLVGMKFERLVESFQTRQNRYGLIFRFPDEVDNRVTTLHPWNTDEVLTILEIIKRLDVLDKTVRWPPQPTLIETIIDIFQK